MELLPKPFETGKGEKGRINGRDYLYTVREVD